MIRLVYLGGDDDMAGLKRGDIFFADVSDNGKWYIFENNLGEVVYIPKNEAVVY